jgi:hypothetical protein
MGDERAECYDGDGVLAVLDEAQQRADRGALGG